MKLWKSKRRVGSVIVRPNRLLWAVSELRGDRWTLSDGGRWDSEPHVGPQPDDLRELWIRHQAEWGLVVPCAARVGLFALPPLAENEIARGLQWQCEKAFGISSADPAIDYERLPTGRPLVYQGRSAAQCNALVVALEKPALEPWIDWASRLPYPPMRLEPTLPAFHRAVTTMPPYGSDDGTLWIYSDAGQVLLITTVAGQSLAVRELGPAVGCGSDPLTQPGLPRLQELLLHCEDRLPELRFRHLVTFGDLDFESVSILGQTLGLEPTRVTAPTIQWPESLAAPEDWVLLYGNLLETGRHE
ncbi:MAG: hypothetical protein KDC38_02260 [Planctomycetes bacterium]|nr:hypothetical protein [Planctomycetota bacterium]